MLNIVIPLAGLGSRFVRAGYKNPKPFIDVDGEVMINKVVKNLTPYQPHRFIFLARREHERYIKKHMGYATDIIYVDKVTEGAACTVLLAKKLINSTDPLIIANSDQLVEWNDECSKKSVSDRASNVDAYWKESNNIEDIINDAKIRDLDGSITTFTASDPKWSYAKLDENDYVSEVAEKNPISNNATVGVYYYRCGRNFVRAAEKMIKKNIRVNNEFYVCPVFNEMIDNAATLIGIYPIRKMMGLGTPEDLNKYELMLYNKGNKCFDSNKKYKCRHCGKISHLDYYCGGCMECCGKLSDLGFGEVIK